MCTAVCSYSCPYFLSVFSIWFVLLRFDVLVVCLSSQRFLSLTEQKQTRIHKIEQNILHISKIGNEFVSFWSLSLRSLQMAFSPLIKIHVKVLSERLRQNQTHRHTQSHQQCMCGSNWMLIIDIMSGIWIRRLYIALFLFDSFSFSISLSLTNSQNCCLDVRLHIICAYITNTQTHVHNKRNFSQVNSFRNRCHYLGIVDTYGSTYTMYTSHLTSRGLCAVFFYRPFVISIVSIHLYFSLLSGGQLFYRYSSLLSS